MSDFVQITPEEWKVNPFKSIGKDWMLITAKKEDKVNTMTAAWGGLGVMWGKNVAYVVIRPQRYTKEFVDAGETFTLSFMSDVNRKETAYLGKVSGRDENKIEKSGLTVKEIDGTPYFEEAKTVLKCKKLYRQEMNAECFLGADEDEKWYPDKDYHFMYIAEIETVLVK